MSQKEVRHEMREGDVYTWSPSSRWARHGMAVVYRAHNDKLMACDTYWRGISGQPSDTDNVPLDKLEEFLGNRDDFRKVHRHEYEQYASSDTLFIPVGGGSEAFYVKKDAQICVERAVQFLQWEIDRERSKIRSAEYRIAQLEKEISERQALASAGRDPQHALTGEELHSQEGVAHNEGETK